MGSRQHRQLTQTKAEHGAPAWVHGLRMYGFSANGKHIYFLRNQEGINTLWQISIDSGLETRLPLDETYTALDGFEVSPDSNRIALLASGGNQPPRVISISTSGSSSEGRVRIHRRATSEELPSSGYSRPEPVRWTGMDGGIVYGLFYPPQNERFEGIGKPPLVVMIHGGPTSQARSAFNPRAQFFTSRGYAVLEVNYRGSTGYGRPYRDMLRGNWGIYDVQDAVSGAGALGDQGRVDGSKRVIIVYPGEGHGFRKAETIEHLYRTIEQFLREYVIYNIYYLVKHAGGEE